MEEIAQKINKIKFDDDVIDFNNDNNLTGDERKLVTAKFSFLCFSFCKKEEKLIDLKNQKEKIYKELDELYQDSKFKTSDYFAGCGFITFINLKEKALFLKRFNHSIIIFKNNLKILKIKINYIILYLKFLILNKCTLSLASIRPKVNSSSAFVAFPFEVKGTKELSSQNLK
jgi:hypothetical protein